MEKRRPGNFKKKTWSKVYRRYMPFTLLSDPHMKDFTPHFTLEHSDRIASIQTGTN